MVDMGEPTAILAALAESDPADSDRIWCHFCERLLSVPHLPDCLWRRAYEWTEEFRGLV